MRTPWLRSSQSPVNRIQDPITIMSSLAGRLRSLQRPETDDLPDLSELSMMDLERTVIDFGQKHLGKTFNQVWEEDQGWILWFTQHYGSSKKLSHRKMIKYIEGKLDHAEALGETIPVREPVGNQIPPSTMNLPVNMGARPKAKAKAKSAAQTINLAEATPLEERVFDLEMEAMSATSSTQVQNLENRMLNVEATLHTIVRHLENIHMNQVTAPGHVLNESFEEWTAP